MLNAAGLEDKLSYGDTGYTVEEKGWLMGEGAGLIKSTWNKRRRGGGVSS